jgi:hypothetical protein
MVKATAQILAATRQEYHLEIIRPEENGAGEIKRLWPIEDGAFKGTPLYVDVLEAVGSRLLHGRKNGAAHRNGVYIIIACIKIG